MTRITDQLLSFVNEDVMQVNKVLVSVFRELNSFRAMILCDNLSKL